MALVGAQFVNAVSPNPVGSLQAYAGASAPTGWLLCDGSAVSRTVYPELFSVLGTTYGAGDGSTTFGLPDLRGRMPIGSGNDGTSANNATRNRGDKGGDYRLQQHQHYPMAGQTNRARMIDVDVVTGTGTNAGGVYVIRDVGSTGNVTADTATGAGGNMPPFLVTNYIIKAVPDAPRSGLAYGSTPPIVTALPSNPQFGEVVTYKHTATGNIGALMPMQYDGTSWKPLATTTLCRWSSGSASQVVNSTNVVNITTGDYGSISFTPPWDGYYEFGIQMRNVQLNSGIGIYVYLSNANFTANYDVAYFEDANGYTYHTRIPITGPRVEYLYASNTYRWATQITYAAGNQGTLFTAGTAYIAAVSR